MRKGAHTRQRDVETYSPGNSAGDHTFARIAGIFELHVLRTRIVDPLLLGVERWVSTG
eukprot:COSAG01_NODE_31281_length_600_cov_1.510978_2_plen_57_part_01